VTAEGWVDADLVSFGPGVSQLQCAEETSTARCNCGHEPQLSKVPLPCLVADASGGGQVLEDGGQGELAVSGEFDGLATSASTLLHN
jgi:hypothetical protein